MRPVRALCLLVLLTGCGRVDSQALFFPEIIRQAQPDRRLPDPEPDSARLIRENLKSVFTESSQPSNVRLSGLRRNLDDAGWNLCIKAIVTTLNKAKLARTYVVQFDRGEIGLRRTATPADGCEAEQYTQL